MLCVLLLMLAMRMSILHNGAALAALVLALSVAGGQAQQSPSSAAGAGARPPEASPNDIAGPALFATSCGFCHQDGGRAEGKGPKLAGSTRSDEFIIERIKNGKVGAMPAFGGAFSEGQIIAILAYIRSLEDNGN
jgi:mono/diheme cytochrome c family protein